METLSAFLRVLRFTTLCLAGVAGLVYLIFDTPWQLSFGILSLTLVAGLVWLSPAPLFPQKCENPFLQEDACAQSEAVLSYRGVKYITPTGTSQSSGITTAPLEAISIDPKNTGQGEIIGKYRGSVIRLPQ